MTERLERELHHAAEQMRRQTLVGMGGGAASTAASADAAAPPPVRGRTQADLTDVLDNPSLLLEARKHGNHSISK